MRDTPSLSAATGLYAKGDYPAALAMLNTLIEQRPEAAAYELIARILLRLDMKAEAAAACRQAAQLDPQRSDALLLDAMRLYFAAGEKDEALRVAGALVHRAQDEPEVAYVLASIFLERGNRSILQGMRGPLARSGQEKHLTLALDLLTDNPTDPLNYETVDAALRHWPDRLELLFYRHMLSREICDFEGIEAALATIRAALDAGRPGILSHEQPLANLTWCGDEALNRLATFTTPAADADRPARRRAMPHRWHEEKIRIGYLSCDFWPGHATMRLLGDVLKRHDRSRFEVFLFCHTAERNLERGGEDRSAWGRIVPVRDLDDAAAAKAVRDHGIDILIDLKGHTNGERVGILNHAAAPLQVAWLGFPGTTVNVDLDYIIGDRIVLPDAARPFFHEKFCRLPECYQPNDPTSRPLPAPLTRAEAGLPEDAFVFASFNSERKVTAEMTDLWARILHQAPGSLLWLFAKGDAAKANLAARFASLGIDRDRIVFAGQADYARHISRMPCADLALDTYPCNGHTTTSDALWSGLPVLTYRGTNFASRVSESLLNAVGLPDLVAADADGYVARAVDLAADPQAVAGYRETLRAGRLHVPLFDSGRFCRHLEAGLEEMVRRARGGLAPDHFDVPAAP